MHREFSPLERLNQPDSHGGLYLLTTLVGLLIGLDVWPAVAGWLNSTWQLSLPVGSESLSLLGRTYRYALLAALLGGARVLFTSLENLWNGKLGADLVLGLAVVAAILLGQPLVAAEVVFIGLLGECLEAYTFGRTQRSLQQLVETCPRMCFVLREGQEQKVRVEEVLPGELVKVLPGKRVPVDGLITEGRTTIDQSTLTGESLPVDKTVGDEVFAGTINQHGALVVQVKRVATQTVMGRVIELTVQAVKEKMTGTRTADLLARYFLPVVLALALATFLASWWWFRGEENGWQRAAYPALSVLVVACPCALILATPAALMAAVGRLAKTGVILKSGLALERLASITCFAFDKTGTLTEGRMQVGSIEPLAEVTAEELLRLAATAEQNSEHPLATAILREARARELALEPLTDFQAQPGAGVIARTTTATLLVGSVRLLAEHQVELTPEAAAALAELDAQGQTALLVVREQRLLGLLGIWDTIRPEAAAVLQDLRRSGIKECVMLTGDRPAAARSVAERLGLERIDAELLPGQKADAIGRLHAAGHQVAMVGDGVNDAPALAKAHVGLALGRTGADIAAEAGDIVLMGDPLKPLPLLFRLSRQTVAIIRQNILIFAFGVNAVGVVVTAWILPFWSEAARLQSPLWAAIYHQIGSLAVLLNAMRLLWFERGQDSATVRRFQTLSTWLDATLERLNLHDASHWVMERWQRVLGWSAGLFLLLYALSGLTMVPPDAIGIVRRCGQPLSEDLPPGLHWRWPWPWEQVTLIEPQRLRQVDVGFRTLAATDAARKEVAEQGASWTWTSPHTAGLLRDPEEALMLTGDGNLLEAQVILHYTLEHPRRYLWEAVEPEAHLRTMTEATVREVLAARPFFEVLAGERRQFQAAVVARLQQRYGPQLTRLGVAVHSVTVQDLHPPPQVVESYYDLTRAQAEQARVISEARMQSESAVAREQVAKRRLVSDAAGRYEMARMQAEAERDVFLWMSAAQRLTLVQPWLLPFPAPTQPWDLAWRWQYGSHLAPPKELTQFRLTVEAAEQILGGRAKVLHDPAVPAPTLVNPDILRLRLPNLGRERPRPPMADERP